MLHKLTNAFVKITAFPVQALIFRTKIHYEDPALQKRRIKGAAIIIANHRSVFDVAAMMFVFFGRTLRPQVAEVIFRKKPLGLFMRMLGAVRVDRNTQDFSFLATSEHILRRGGVMEIYPESRLPRAGEETPLPFKPSAAYLALVSGVPVIPVYTSGAYFTAARNHVVIGAPIDPMEHYDPALSEKENIAILNQVFRDKIISLEAHLCEKQANRTKT